MQTATVSLKTIDEKDSDILSQLLYEYQRELLPYSGNSPNEIKTYKYLPDYFTDSERAAFFIMVNHEIGGFVLVNTLTITQIQAHSIAEFYVAPTFRQNGVGERAAALTFAKFPGRWEVAQMEANDLATRFWRKVINKITQGQFKEVALNTEVWHGPVQTFDII